MRKLGFLAGAALGYVLGAKAGRERYEQIRSTAQKLANHPTVQQVKTEAQDQASRIYGSAKDKISNKVSDTGWIPIGKGDTGASGAGEFTSDDTWASATRSKG
ncbi:MAG TPA: YtxH domain-containing protein [Actinomycetes bacterium]|nr:YtxH domain-containing protein [Actinomycetes bacterium]